MMIFAAGINHKTAPIKIRERFYLNETERELLLSLLQCDPSVFEAFVLSTCNRTEVYAHVMARDYFQTVLQHLFRVKKIALTPELQKYFYAYTGHDAVRHLLTVSAGLDSIVLGERQVLGQVKAAVELSRHRGMLGKEFNVLTGLAVRAGKKAHHETDISCGGVSVSWAAVTAAGRALGTLRDKSILIIGAGKMGHLAAAQLKNRGAGRIYVMNRSEEKAKDMAAQFNAVPVSFWGIKDILGKVDVCITSSGAPHYIIEKDLVKRAVVSRGQRRLVCVDISVPRNIDPAVAEVKDVSLITIDDLGGVVAENMEKRRGADGQVRVMIEGKIEEYERKISKIRACETARFGAAARGRGKTVKGREAALEDNGRGAGTEKLVSALR